MALEIIHRFTCDYCGASQQTSRKMATLEIATDLERPYGWRWVGDKLACPAHEVVVKDRRQEPAP